MHSHGEVLTALGEAIRQARLRRGVSQEELADASGLHRTYISSVERGERNLGFINLVKIAQALNVKVSVLTRHLDDLVED